MLAMLCASFHIAVATIRMPDVGSLVLIPPKIIKENQIVKRRICRCEENWKLRVREVLGNHEA